MNIKTCVVEDISGLIKLARLEYVSNPSFGGINSLLRQVSGTSRIVKRRTLNSFFETGNSLAVAIDNERIIGIAALVVVRYLDGATGQIEDVVVNEKYPRMGIAQDLLTKLIEIARIHELSEIDLTARPSRIPANALYLKLGFVKRDTNCYRLTLGK